MCELLLCEGRTYSGVRSGWCRMLSMSEYLNYDIVVIMFCSVLLIFLLYCCEAPQQRTRRVAAHNRIVGDWYCQTSMVASAA